MSSAMPFSFNAVEFCVVTINEKPWIRAREVCRALEYDAKTSKAANIIKAHCDPENITQKYQMSSVHPAYTPINWPKDSQKYNVYTNEEGMYEVNNQRQKTSEDTAAMSCFLMFDSSPQIKGRKSINKPLKKKMQQLHCLPMICRTVTIRFKPFSMKTWHWKHKRMCIKPSYKNVKIPSPILKRVMFLMREILIKTTLSSM